MGKETCVHLSKGPKEACVFDVCASGGSQTAGKEDVVAAATAINAAHTTQMFGFLGPLFGQAAIPVPLQWALGIFVAGLMFSGVTLGLKSRRGAASDMKF